MLSTILKRIGGKDTTQDGLNELFHYQQDNPSADMDYFYSRMSSEFRIYVQRGLAKRAAKRAGDQPPGLPSTENICCHPFGHLEASHAHVMQPSSLDLATDSVNLSVVYVLVKCNAL